ncbi:hypothetical protein GA0061087_11413, partial [Priestia flexa]
KNIVRKRVEKYFFDTPPTAQTVDKSTFIEGGYTYVTKVHEKPWRMFLIDK